MRLPFARPLTLSTIAAVCFSLGALGCSSTSNEEPGPSSSGSGKLMLEMTTNPDPPQVGVNQVELTFHDAESHAPVNGLSFTVVPWMPHHNHGSSSEPVVTPEGDGKYLVENVVFTMPGDWELRIHVTSPFHDELTKTLTIY